jgi:hypothetical protein
MAKKVYTCQTCGALAEEPGHLCNPNMDPMTWFKITYRIRPLPGGRAGVGDPPIIRATPKGALNFLAAQVFRIRSGRHAGWGGS